MRMPLEARRTKKNKKSKKDKKEGKGKAEKQTEEGGETDILDPVASDAEQETRRSVGSILASEDYVGAALVDIEESPNEDAVSPQGEQTIDEELSPGAPLDTDGDDLEKKNKKEKSKEKKNKKEKKEKKTEKK